MLAIDSLRELILLYLFSRYFYVKISSYVILSGSIIESSLELTSEPLSDSLSYMFELPEFSNSSIILFDFYRFRIHYFLFVAHFSFKYLLMTNSGFGV
jgi:hypothetical protein